MSTKIKITKGKYKGKSGKVVGRYMNGDVDVKIKHTWIILGKNDFIFIN